MVPGALGAIGGAMDAVAGSPSDLDWLSAHRKRLSGVLAVVVAQLARQGHDPCRIWRHPPAGGTAPGAATAQERWQGPRHGGGRRTEDMDPECNLLPEGAVPHAGRPDGRVHVDVRLHEQARR